MKLWNKKRNYNIYEMKIEIFEIKNKRKELNEINKKKKIEIKDEKKNEWWE